MYNFCPAWILRLFADTLESLCAVVGMIKLALQAGKANPAPPVGPALGSKVGQQRDYSC